MLNFHEFSRIIKFALVRFADSQQLMSKRQHGFLQGRSCLTNLLNASEQWTRALDKKGRRRRDILRF